MTPHPRSRIRARKSNCTTYPWEELPLKKCPIDALFLRQLRSSRSARVQASGEAAASLAHFSLFGRSSPSRVGRTKWQMMKPRSTTKVGPQTRGGHGGAHLKTLSNLTAPWDHICVVLKGLVDPKILEKEGLFSRNRASRSHHVCISIISIQIFYK